MVQYQKFSINVSIFVATRNYLTNLFKGASLFAVQPVVSVQKMTVVKMLTN